MAGAAAVAASTSMPTPQCQHLLCTQLCCSSCQHLNANTGYGAGAGVEVRGGGRGATSRTKWQDGCAEAGSKSVAGHPTNRDAGIRVTP